jgi:hypothetical protein
VPTTTVTKAGALRNRITPPHASYFVRCCQDPAAAAPSNEPL